MLLEYILTAGPVAWLLLGLSALALGLVLERFWVQLNYPVFRSGLYGECKHLLQCGDLNALLSKSGAKSRGLQAGVVILVKNRNTSDKQRQQLGLSWLVGEQRYLNARLKLVGLIAAMAPLLGLLGTVFGIIEMFKAIAHSAGPVTPALLAEGLWQAMVTTALGLVIAIPALAASQGLAQLSQWRLEPIQEVLNEVNVELQRLSERAAFETLNTVDLALPPAEVA